MSLPWALLGLASFAFGCGGEPFEAAQGGTSGAGGASGQEGDGGSAGGAGFAGESGAGGLGGVSGVGGATGAAGGAGLGGQGGLSGAAGAVGGAGQGGESAGKGGSSGGAGGIGGAGSSGFAGTAGSAGFSGMPSGAGGISGMAGGNSSGGVAGVAGSGGLSGSGGASQQTYVLKLLRPAADQVLPPTRAYLLWKDESVPSGLSVAGYDVCSTTDASAIVGADECPNLTAVADPHHVLKDLAAGVSYFWKVRAHFNDASMSEYSEVRVFSTDKSLAGQWDMEGDAKDASSAANDGVLQNGAGFGAGIDGQALVCNGTNQYADMGEKDGLNLQGPLTISAWVFAEGVPEGNDTGIVNNGALSYALTYHKDGNAWFYINNGGNNAFTSMSPGAWHHLTGVFDGTTDANSLRLYLDGSLVASKASSSATTGASGNFWVGRYGDSYFHGAIDDVAIYGAALNEAAILNDECAVRALSNMAPPAACLP